VLEGLSASDGFKGSNSVKLVANTVQHIKRQVKPSYNIAVRACFVTGLVKDCKVQDCYLHCFIC
jgi:hypothetical protein